MLLGRMVSCSLCLNYCISRTIGPVYDTVQPQSCRISMQNAQTNFVQTLSTWKILAMEMVQVQIRFI